MGKTRTRGDQEVRRCRCYKRQRSPCLWKGGIQGERRVEDTRGLGVGGVSVSRCRMRRLIQSANKCNDLGEDVY